LRASKRGRECKLSQLTNIPSKEAKAAARLRKIDGELETLIGKLD
jgi:hypothetical protein